MSRVYYVQRWDSWLYPRGRFPDKYIYIYIFIGGLSDHCFIKFISIIALSPSPFSFLTINASSGFHNPRHGNEDGQGEAKQRVKPRSFFLSRTAGDSVVHNSPSVGQYLYDNPRNGISVASLTPLKHSLIQVVEVKITNSGDYLEASSNVILLSSPARFVLIRAPASPPHLMRPPL